MRHRQAVEFLRRRYAAAILRGDADTAGRLRAQLDGIMNHACGAGGTAEARPADAQSPARPPDLPSLPAGGQAAEPSADRAAPTLRLVTPVTGLLEGRRRRR